MSEDRAADWSVLILRTAVGSTLVAHGANKLRGPGGLKGTTAWFESLGLRPAAVHARLAATTEITAGGLLTLGAFSPLPAAGVVGLMAVAGRTDHRGKGFFVFKGGWEYVGLLGAGALATAVHGPGRYSFDALLGARRRGLRWGTAALALGVANAALLLATSYTPVSEHTELAEDPTS